MPVDTVVLTGHMQIGKVANMGINSESSVEANLQIGPTSLGMVRMYLETDEVQLPLDFYPEEAEEIAGELQAAATRARAMARKPG
jgi:hypothetical protein